MKTHRLKCHARSTLNTIDPHECMLRRGHAGQHVCGRDSVGPLAQPFAEPRPCRCRWNSRKKRAELRRTEGKR